MCSPKASMWQKDCCYVWASCAAIQDVTSS